MDSLSLENTTAISPKVEQTKTLPQQPKLQLFGAIKPAQLNPSRLASFSLLKVKTSDEIDKKDVSSTDNDR